MVVNLDNEVYLLDYKTEPLANQKQLDGYHAKNYELLCHKHWFISEKKSM
jgi:hypothetical protein